MSLSSEERNHGDTERGGGLQAAGVTPLSLRHPRSPAGLMHVPATLTRSSGFGSAFNRCSALTGVLPGLGADLESPAGHRCLRASQAPAAANKVCTWG